MTPIKYVGWFKCLVFCVDHADQVEMQCVAVSERQAEWVARSLARAHNVESKRVDGLPVMQY